MGLALVAVAVLVLVGVPALAVADDSAASSDAVANEELTTEAAPTTTDVAVTTTDPASTTAETTRTATSGATTERAPEGVSSGIDAGDVVATTASSATEVGDTFATNATRDWTDASARPSRDLFDAGAVGTRGAVAGVADDGPTAPVAELTGRSLVGADADLTAPLVGTDTGDGGNGASAGGRDAPRTTVAAGTADGGGDGREPGGTDAPLTPSDRTELAISASALAAAALFPQFADLLSVLGNAGFVSASSTLIGSIAGERSRVRGRRSLRDLFDRAWRVLIAFRYSRWDDSDPLSNETRVALYEEIEQSPGGYLSEICDRTGVAVSTARHHLDVLEAEGLVTTAKVRGKRRYYPAHVENAAVVTALEDESTAAILRALARVGACHGGRLADELDRDPSTISHHLSWLEDAELIERERDGRAIVNRLAPAVDRTLRGGEHQSATAD
ncbi:hypothetical protein BRC82_00340 [Halobacteriales archaeon QS_1_67_19]|nr:MAG: hypothetical protein BRC82_00340 [Halobacteriales archaeon QS_1_67_19]